MSQKFKFGDRVRVLKKSVYNQEIGVVTKISNTPKPRYRVAFENDLDLTFSESELELVPDPDTARLDWIESRSHEVSETAVMYDGYNWYSNTNEEYPIELGFPYEAVRQAIDKAMQQEQKK